MNELKGCRKESDMQKKQKISDQFAWARPNDFFLAMRCTETRYAKDFVERGSIKFNTPQSWVDWELSNGKGRGDLFEGTVAYCNMFDAEKVAEFYKKYPKCPLSAFFISTIGQKLFVKRWHSMYLPVFCFYILNKVC